MPKQQRSFNERYLKVSPKSDGYKRGIRYIDFGQTESAKIRMLKHKPKK